MMMDTRVIFTKEWLDEIEFQVNEMAYALIEEARQRYTTFSMPFAGHNGWSMEVANKMAAMKAQQIKKITPFENFISNTGVVSKSISVHVTDPSERFEVDIVLYWDSQKYQTVGILIPLSEYIKVAESTNYKIEIACSKGYKEFASPFVVWYYNDSPKVKGKHKVDSLPMDIGSCCYLYHTCSKGFGSDPLMTLNGTNHQWSFDLLAEAGANGNPDGIFDFWNC